MTLPILQILLDGAADRKISAFDGATPLQAARTPRLDRLAAEGVSGLMDVGPPGVPLHSPAAHGLLWGYDLEELPARSLLASRGAGLSVEGYDVLFFFYLVSGERGPEGWHVRRRYPDTELDPFRGGMPASEDVATGPLRWHFEFTALGGNSGVARGRLEGASMPDRIRLTDSDPFQDDFPLVQPDRMQKPEKESEVVDAYVRAVRTLIRRSAEWFSGHEAYDFMAPKWHTVAGSHEPAPLAARWGLDGATNTTKDGVGGLADMLGMSRLESPTDFERRVKEALGALGEHDFVHCHFPETDAPGHRGDPAAKKNVLEQIDAALDPLPARTDDLLIVVTSDHSTPCRPRGEHGGDRVALLLAGPETRVDDVDRFDEVSAARGGFGPVRARTLMPRLLDLSGRSLMYEVRRHPSDPTYRLPPGDVDPYVPGEET